MGDYSIVFEWREAIRDSRTLSTRARCVALILSLRMNEKGECWPSVDRIGAEAGMGRQTARNAILELEREHYLSVDIVHGKGKTNTYRLNPSVLFRNRADRAA